MVWGLNGYLSVWDPHTPYDSILEVVQNELQTRIDQMEEELEKWKIT